MHLTFIFCNFLYLDEQFTALSELEYAQQVISEDSLIFVAGYVAHRYRIKHPSLGTPTKNLPASHPPDWIVHASRGNLIYPSKELISVAKLLEFEFNEFHGNYLSDQDKIFTKLANIVNNKISEESRIPMEVLLCLVRTRTYIRLKLINKQRLDAISNTFRNSRRSHKKQQYYA